LPSVGSIGLVLLLRLGDAIQTLMRNVLGGGELKVELFKDFFGPGDGAVAQLGDDALGGAGGELHEDCEEGLGGEGLCRFCGHKRKSADIAVIIIIIIEEEGVKGKDDLGTDLLVPRHRVRLDPAVRVGLGLLLLLWWLWLLIVEQSDDEENDVLL